MNQEEVKRKDFEEIFGEALSDRVGKKIEDYKFVYEDFTAEERDALILRILEVLNAPDIIRAGQHRLDQWNDGWAENLTLLKESSPSALIPKYFGKYPRLRWRQKFIKPISDNFEYNMLAAIQDWLFDRYLKDVGSIYEFGCGTGHNLKRAREANSEAILYGLDWVASSQEIIALTAEKENDKKLKGIRFDMFHPDKTLSLDENSGIYTIAALEQIGDGFKDFVAYLLDKKPKICIHVEPIGEVLDPRNLMDYLSLQYFKKRNYLNGFLEYLQGLEKEEKIVIHKVQRGYIGSLFIEGYSIIVWSPK